jgi:hypothetical protein
MCSPLQITFQNPDVVHEAVVPRKLTGVLIDNKQQIIVSCLDADIFFKFKETVLTFNDHKH